MSQPLARTLQEILESHAEGVSEHELLRRLQGLRLPEFPPHLFKDSLALFRAHFLLFHALYRLDEELQRRRSGALRIAPLRIRLRPFADPAGAQLGRADSLRAYYLDLGNLSGVRAADVDRLLGEFWVRYCAREQRVSALAVLGLTDPVDAAAIKRRYRRLAMALHPDRGGDTTRFQALQEAMDMLGRC
jgi:hypothetical protein